MKTKMQKAKVDGTLIHCLHGHRIPVFDMTEGKENSVKVWIHPKLMFTLALCEAEPGVYSFGASIILNAKDQYNKKIGREIAKGRAKSSPFLKVAASTMTKDEAIEVLYQAGYKIANTPKHLAKRWVAHKFDGTLGNRILSSFVLNSGKVLEVKDIDPRYVSGGEGF